MPMHSGASSSALSGDLCRRSAALAAWPVASDVLASSPGFPASSTILFAMSSDAKDDGSSAIWLDRFVGLSEAAASALCLSRIVPTTMRFEPPELLLTSAPSLDFILSLSSRTSRRTSLGTLKAPLKSSPPLENSAPKMRLTATTAASLHSAARSAPTKPLHFFASACMSSCPSRRIWRHKTCRIRARALTSGIPSAISLSNRPARRKAGSRASGRLVAPMTITGEPPHPSSVSSSMHVSI
mmetsp:Transcript_27985/g.46505  ORF Transcript_27985/g.46505 Transcript_27985/m.46505 type:complete len:241 (+) Transcript_27985:108-830(+)